MTPRTKRIALVTLIVALAAVLLLSTSLSDMQLRASQPFSAGDNADPAARNMLHMPVGQPGSIPLLETVLGILLLILMIYVSARLVDIRKLLALVVGIVLLVALLNLLPPILAGQPASRARSTPELATPRPIGSPVAVPEGPSPALRWLIAACVLFGTGLLATRLLQGAASSGQSTEALSQTAENALHDMSAGNDFADVIIRCYLQMAEILRTERRLERHHTMTVGEFRNWLEQKGIPTDPVHRLTFLFEKARYGKESMSQFDEDAGQECLRQIVQYCRKESPEGTWTGS